MVSLLELVTQESSMHGVRHITNARRNKFSKLFWLAVVCTSISVLCVSSYNIYLKWNVEPEIGMRVNQKSMTQMPFPAVTICSPVFARDNLVNFTRAMDAIKSKHKVSFEPREQNYLAANSHACIPSLMKSIAENTKGRTNFDTMKLISESSLNASEMLRACTFREGPIDCKLVYTRILTDYGYCFTHNMLDHNELFNRDVISPDFDSYKKTIEIGKNLSHWKLFGNYQNVQKNQVIFFPVRATKVNAISFYAYLNETDTRNNCQMTGKVFPIILHMPNETPTPFHEEVYLEFGRKKTVTLVVKTYKSTESLRKYPPEKRGCYFEDERELMFYKSYTKAHCDFECMANFTLAECGCVKFSMPRTKDTPVCDVDKGECYHNAMLNWPKDDGNSHRPCDCLDTCSNIRYSVVNSKDSPLGSFNGPTMEWEGRRGTYSHLTVRTKSHVIDEAEHFAAYQLQNFVADIGGLLGLFMGCSILSLVELIYFVVTGGIQKIKLKELKLTKRTNLSKKIYNKTLMVNTKKISPKMPQKKSSIKFLRALDQSNVDFYIQRRVLEATKK